MIVLKLVFKQGGFEIKREKLNFLIVSVDALASDIAYTLKKEGMNVKFYIQNLEEKTIMDGFVEKVDDWEAEKDWADIIIFDDVGFGTRADELRRQGYKVIGGSKFTDELELDRKKGVEFVRKVMPEVKIPESVEFESFDEAISFVEERKGRWVVKFEGLTGNIKDLLYCGRFEDGSDLISILQFYKNNWKSEWGSPKFILQEFIEGVELGLTAYFNGEEFVKPYYLNFEYKPLRDGDVGVMTGQEGEHQVWTFKKDKLFNMTFKKMESYLREAGYVGSLDINGIATSDGYYFLEFTSRFGYNSVSLEIQVFKQHGLKFSSFLNSLVLKDRTIFNEVKPCHALGVVVSVPTYPFKEGFDVYGNGLPVLLKGEGVEHFHPHDLAFSNGVWTTTGLIGYACSVCACGENFLNVKNKVYEVLRKGVIIPKMQYRQDIGYRWLGLGQRDKLIEWGYL